MLERLFGTFPDVIQLLRDDHKLVRSLFAQPAEQLARAIRQVSAEVNAQAAE